MSLANLVQRSRLAGVGEDDRVQAESGSEPRGYRLDGKATAA